jgi:hypothetical protein
VAGRRSTTLDNISSCSSRLFYRSARSGEVDYGITSGSLSASREPRDRSPR